VALVAVLVSTAVMGGCRGKGDANASPPSTSAKPPAATASCALQVVDSGFTNRYGPGGNPATPAQGVIDFAFIVSNPCPQTAVHNSYVATGMDSAGHAVAYRYRTGPVGSAAGIPDLASGRRIGLTGEIANDTRTGPGSDAFNATQVAAVQIKPDSMGWQPAASAPAPATASAQDITLGSRRPDGLLPISFTLKVDGALREDWMSIIVRDGSGRIVTGDQRQVDIADRTSGAVVHTEVWVPASPAPAHVEIYFVADRT
jgi:hypothetical protein